MHTGEAISYNLFKKMNAILDILAFFEKHNFKFNQAEYIRSNIRCIDMESIRYIIEFYATKKMHNFLNYLNAENVCGKLDRYLAYSQSFVNILLDQNQDNQQKHDITNTNQKHDSTKQKHDSTKQKPMDLKLYEQFMRYVNLYNETYIIQNYTDTVVIQCPTCQVDMVMVYNTSEYLCEKCGLSEFIKGNSYDKEASSYTNVMKKISYDSSKHCRFWVERIQAKESLEIEQNILEKIKNKLKQDSCYSPSDTTCSTIRKNLRILHYTRYNEHVPLIRKMITGISPPQLTDQELYLIYNYFDKVVYIFNTIKAANKSNCLYHPYFIYKIVEQILINNNNFARLQGILSCIHLQSRDTLIINDRIWKIICEKMTEFKYKPTNREDY